MAVPPTNLDDNPSVMVIDPAKTSVRIRGEGVATYPKGTGYGPRILSDFELVWMLAGTATWLVEDREVQAAPGMVLLACPGMHDAFRWDRRRTTVHGYLHFELVGEVPDHRNWPRWRVLPEEDLLRPLFRHVGWLLGQPGTEAQVNQAVHLALAAFLSGRVGCAGPAEGELPPAVRRMLDGITTAIDTRLQPDLADLVHWSGVSRSSLAVLVKETLGCTPMEVLRLLRLDRAVQLLTRTDLAVQEIAALVGFPDAFHFSRCFQREFGQPPRTFRRLALQGRINPEARPMARRMAQLRPRDVYL